MLKVAAVARVQDVQAAALHVHTSEPVAFAALAAALAPDEWEYVGRLALEVAWAEREEQDPEHYRAPDLGNTVAEAAAGLL